MQAFEVLRTLETKKLAGNLVEDVISPKKCILLTDDTARTVYIYQGPQSPFVDYLLAKRLALEIRKLMRGFYTVQEGISEDQYQVILKSPIEDQGKISEILNQNRRTPDEISANKSASVIDNDSSWENRLMPEDVKVFKNPSVRKTLVHVRDMKSPDKFRTDMVLIGTAMYGYSERPKSFMEDEKIKKKMDVYFEQLGTLPEGKFFQPGYCSRISVKGGRIQSLEFIKPLKKNISSRSGKLAVPLLEIPRIMNPGSISEMKTAFQIPPKEPVENLINKLKSK